MIESAGDKVKSWREDVINAVTDEIQTAGWIAPDGPVELRLTFWLRKPPSLPKRRRTPYTKPDLDKLVRSTMDALKIAGAITDDARVIKLEASKFYAEPDRPTGANIDLVDWDVSISVQDER